MEKQNVSTEAKIPYAYHQILQLVVLFLYAVLRLSKFPRYVVFTVYRLAPCGFGARPAVGQTVGVLRGVGSCTFWEAEAWSSWESSILA